MAKYDPLRDHLRRQTLGELMMTFGEVEDLVGLLPPSADRPQWWANVRNLHGPHVQRAAWRDAGYDAFLISGARKVRFVKLAPENRSVRPPRLMRPKQTATAPPPLATKPALTAQALSAGGFELTSRWILSDGRLALERPLPRQPGVYVFAMRGLAVYVGIAASGLSRRLGFYIRPGVTQRTSQRVNAHLLAELPAAGSVDIMTAMPPDASWNGWPINASAGLEVGLIANYNVPWNLRGI